MIFLFAVLVVITLLWMFLYQPVVQSRTGFHPRGSCWYPFPFVWESPTCHCGSGFLRVRVRVIKICPTGHPCPSLAVALPTEKQIATLPLGIEVVISKRPKYLRYHIWDPDSTVFEMTAEWTE